MPSVDSIIQSIILGITIGGSSTFGAYLMNRTLIKRFDQLFELFNNKKGGDANNDKNTGEGDRGQQSGLCYR